MGAGMLLVMGLQYVAVWLSVHFQDDKPWLGGTFLFYALANFCLVMHMRSGR